jgi:hypothetical protein
MNSRSRRPQVTAALTSNILSALDSNWRVSTTPAHTANMARLVTIHLTQQHAHSVNRTLYEIHEIHEEELHLHLAHTQPSAQRCM